MNLAQVPSLFIGFRFVMALLLLWDASDHQTGTWFVVGYSLAIVSDIFDGIIARRLGVSTPKLRQADSWADICLFLVVAVSTWLVHPEVILAFRVPLLIALFAQLSLFGLSLAKFQQMPSFHTYTAKAWGLALLMATISVFGFGVATPLWGAIFLCLLNTTEEILMTLILDEWHCDVLSILHARELRRQPNKPKTL